MRDCKQELSASQMNLSETIVRRQDKTSDRVLDVLVLKKVSRSANVSRRKVCLETSQNRGYNTSQAHTLSFLTWREGRRVVIFYYGTSNSNRTEGKSTQKVRHVSHVRRKTVAKVHHYEHTRKAYFVLSSSTPSRPVEERCIDIKGKAESTLEVHPSRAAKVLTLRYVALSQAGRLDFHQNSGIIP